MSDVTPVGPMTRFGRLERRGLLLGLGGAQVAVLGVALALIVFGMYTRGGSGLLITAVLWVPLAAAALVSVGGRPLVGWLPIVAHWQTRGLLDQTEYRVKPGRVRRIGQLALPGDAARLRLVLGPVSSAALIYDPAARTLTAVALVSAPAFDLVDTDTQHARVNGWGRLLASLTPSAGVARVQVLARTVPETGVELARYWAEHGVRDGSWAAHVVADLVASAPSPRTPRGLPCGQRRRSPSRRGRESRRRAGTADARRPRRRVPRGSTRRALAGQGRAGVGAAHRLRPVRRRVDARPCRRCRRVGWPGCGERRVGSAACRRRRSTPCTGSPNGRGRTHRPHFWSR